MSSDTTPKHFTPTGQRRQIDGTISPFTSESRRACAVSTRHAVGELLGALTAAMEERGVRLHIHPFTLLRLPTFTLIFGNLICILPLRLFHRNQSAVSWVVCVLGEPAEGECTRHSA